MVEIYINTHNVGTKSVFICYKNSQRKGKLLFNKRGKSENLIGNKNQKLLRKARNKIIFEKS